MHILLDECVNPRLRHAFPDHQVTTVAEADWLGLSDTRLLALADRKFDVFITLDQGFAYQQNTKHSSFGIVIIHISKNALPFYGSDMDELQRVIREIRPGTIAHVQLRSAR